VATILLDGLYLKNIQMLTSEDVIEAVRLKPESPANVRELMDRLELPPAKRVFLRRLLEKLVKAGELIKVRTNRYGLPNRTPYVTGRIEINPRGFGFVVPDKAESKFTSDVFVASENLNTAMHGDRVVVCIERYREEGRAEGHIVRVIERSLGSFIGRYETNDLKTAYVVPFDRRFLMNIDIPSGESKEAKPGDMVAIRFTRWPTLKRGPLGKVVEVFGDIDAPGVDSKLIISKHGLPSSHSSEAISEAKGFGTYVENKDTLDRKDFRMLLTVTIDGETARDFDDAITLAILPNGNFSLGVHIADVARYVSEGGALDISAYERGTSVYFPDQAIHMFPEVLATGLCSLKPKVDRLVQSCLMEIDFKGEVKTYEFHDGVINSDARMTYTEVNAILVDKDKDNRDKYVELVPLFERMEALFNVLNDRRNKRGSIDFDLPKAKLLIDKEGRVEAIVASERNLAHRIIEEFMLIANETAARHLNNAGISTLYRVHEEPDPIKVSEFEDFVSSLGFSLGRNLDNLKPKNFQSLMRLLKGKPEERSVAFLMLRTMQQARYDPVCLGHFGLATDTYTHFTSPIRRYPDLVVHRALRKSRSGVLNDTNDNSFARDLPVIAKHTSEMERRAEVAEREIVQWKKVRFMADKVGNEFTGYVVGVTGFGLFIELVEHYVEGLVHIASITDDYYRYFERQQVLKGENNGKAYKLGDFVKVQLVRVDQENRRLELALVDILQRINIKQRRKTVSNKSVSSKKSKQRRATKRSRRRS